MQYREACLADIAQLSRVRLSVTENVLSDQSLITDADYVLFLTERGKGWVCECNDVIVGFSIVDLSACNVWALFVQQRYEGMGIGKKLQQLLLDWYFLQTGKTIWLGTAPASRAEGFYRKTGWQETGRRLNGEIRFEMTYANWSGNRIA